MSLFMKNLICLFVPWLGWLSMAWAQFPPREEDHFWRRKVVNRIDLEEKINRPLIQRESGYYQGGLRADTLGPQQKDGLVVALIKGLMDGHYTAYEPDDPTQQLDSREVIDRIDEPSSSSSSEAAVIDSAEAAVRPEDGALPPMDDPFVDPFAPVVEAFTDTVAPSPGSGAPLDFDTEGRMPDTAPFESVIQFVEDRIFDKNRSDLVYDIQYIELIWVDPYGQLEDKPLCTFRYEEVLGILEDTQWKNRFNDAQYRSMREVFEMRLFHSYMIDISGQGIQSLSEAEYRRQQLLEFEHHLWSY